MAVIRMIKATNAKQSVSIEVLFLLGECDARSTDGAR
jgi:hypothetical protein